MDGCCCPGAATGGLLDTGSGTPARSETHRRPCKCMHIHRNRTRQTSTAAWKRAVSIAKGCSSGRQAPYKSVRRASRAQLVFFRRQGAQGHLDESERHQQVPSAGPQRPAPAPSPRANIHPQDLPRTISIFVGTPDASFSFTC
jgi:hypothetical protein